MWEPITKDELDELIATDLADCSEDQRAIYARNAITPEKWCQSPWGDDRGRFLGCRDLGREGALVQRHRTRLQRFAFRHAWSHSR